MRIGGLASGMDTDSIVEQLMTVERAPLDKLEQQKQTYEWQRDSYREVNTKLSTLDTYIADNLLFKTFNSKTATSSNSDYVTATATGSASGTLTIEGVSQLATAARGIGNQVNATGSTTLGTLFNNSSVAFPTSNNYIELRAIKSDGTLSTEKTRIDYSSDMTIDQFISKVNGSNAGVNAVFENGRLSITAKNTGDVKGDSEIVVDYGGEVFKAFGFQDPTNIISKEGKNAIFQVNGIATERSSNAFTISGYSITLKNTFNSDSTVNALLESAYKTWRNARTDLTSLQATFNDKNIAYQSALDSFNAVKDTNFLQQELTTPGLSDKYKSVKNTEILTKLSYEQFNALKDLTIDTTSESAIGASINNLSSELFTTEEKEALKVFTGAELTSLQNIEATEEEFNELKRVANLEATYESMDKSVLAQLTEEDYNKLSSYDLTGDNPLEAITDPTLKEKMSSLKSEQIKSLGELSQEQFTAFTTLAAKEEELELSKLEEEMKKAESDITVTTERRDDAKSVLEKLFKENGILTEDATTADLNNLLVNEYSLDNLPQVPNPEPNEVSAVTLTSTTDVEDMVTKIKDFVTKYNTLIKELNDLTKEEKYRDYKPLTTLQREGMEESEIKLWEEKSKSGLLKNDTIIQNGLSAMRSLIYQSNPEVANTKFNTLYSIGITTSSNYLEGGTLEIDETKLRKALEEDPDAVTTLFRNSEGKQNDTVIVNGETKTADTRGFLQKLRGTMDTITANIEKRAGRSSMNQSQYTLGKNLKEVEDSISTWKDKLSMLEDRYWKQFTAMETAISKANSQFSLFSTTTA